MVAEVIKVVLTIFALIGASDPLFSWISSTNKRKNSYDNFDALRHHYRSEGNSRRHAATTDRLQDTLHYKSERALSFNTFLYRI